MNSDQQPVPVFTIKLYRPSAEGERMAMLCAHRLEMERQQDQVTIIVQDEAGKEKDRYRIGAGQSFAWAVIENPSGKTTEVVRPRISRITIHGPPP